MTHCRRQTDTDTGYIWFYVIYIYMIIYAHAYVYMYVCMCVCVYVCMYVCLSVCMSVCLYVFVCVCMDGWMDGCMDVCMYVCLASDSAEADWYHVPCHWSQFGQARKCLSWPLEKQKFSRHFSQLKNRCFHCFFSISFDAFRLWLGFSASLSALSATLSLSDWSVRSRLTFRDSSVTCCLADIGHGFKWLQDGWTDGRMDIGWTSVFSLDAFALFRQGARFEWCCDCRSGPPSHEAAFSRSYDITPFQSIPVPKRKSKLEWQQSNQDQPRSTKVLSHDNMHPYAPIIPCFVQSFPKQIDVNRPSRPSRPPKTACSPFLWETSRTWAVRPCPTCQAAARIMAAARALPSWAACAAPLSAYTAPNRAIRCN